MYLLSTFCLLVVWNTAVMAVTKADLLPSQQISALISLSCQCQQQTEEEVPLWMFLNAHFLSSFGSLALSWLRWSELILMEEQAEA